MAFLKKTYTKITDKELDKLLSPVKAEIPRGDDERSHSMFLKCILFSVVFKLANFVCVDVCFLEGWNTAGQFQGIFCHLMVQFGVSVSTSEKVAPQDETMSLLAVEMSSSPSEEESKKLPSSFVNISALVCNHRYLPTCFGSFMHNVREYISGFVVW